tara:strand:+ start:301 stop:804 length:504 start_codon:yes stop_codon:yes gene_type:complete
MNKKFTKEEKQQIVKEASESKDKVEIAVKYDIHYTTLYGWIRKFNNEKSRTNWITIKVSDSEKEKVKKMCKALGFENEVSSYIRKLLLSKHIATGNPNEIVKELYSARGELNKVGSNLNQIANYTNFLMNQNYVEEGFAKDLKGVLNEFLKASSNHKMLIDKTLKKI